MQEEPLDHIRWMMMTKNFFYYFLIKETKSVKGNRKSYHLHIISFNCLNELSDKRDEGRGGGPYSYIGVLILENIVGQTRAPSQKLIPLDKSME